MTAAAALVVWAGAAPETDGYRELTGPPAHHEFVSTTALLAAADGMPNTWSLLPDSAS